MKIGIIGGGITGLTAGYELLLHGHDVTIFEKDPVVGGLAAGFTKKTWDTYLEYAYHHVFTNDNAIQDMLKKLDLGSVFVKFRPITATYFPQGRILPLDAPQHIFALPGLTLLDKIRLAGSIAFCKLNPFGSLLTSVSAQSFFTLLCGKNVWEKIWEPLMVGKFDSYTSRVAASWLWARIYKRTPSLLYPTGGFQTIIAKFTSEILRKKGKIFTNCTVSTIAKNKNGYTITTDTSSLHVDKILLTTPTPLLPKLIPDMPASFLQSSLTIAHLHAQVLILVTDKPILDRIYWLNINDRTFPFLVMCQHTNLIDPIHFGGKHITYIGNYLPDNHPFLKLTKEQLLNKFLPFLKQIQNKTNGSETFTISDSKLFIGPFAQPVHETNYAKNAPPFKTPWDGVFLANMDSIFPWDRGTNYAVELGQKAANEMMKK